MMAAAFDCCTDNFELLGSMDELVCDAIFYSEKIDRIACSSTDEQAGKFLSQLSVRIMEDVYKAQKLIRQYDQVNLSQMTREEFVDILEPLASRLEFVGDCMADLTI